jgi:hypothetical protein
VLISGHGHAGEQHGDAGGGVEEGHGKGVELFADLADVTELRETTVTEDLVNDLLRKVQEDDFLLVLRDKHSLRRRHHPVTTWGDSLTGMEVRRHLGSGECSVIYLRNKVLPLEEFSNVVKDLKVTKIN